MADRAIELNILSFLVFPRYSTRHPRMFVAGIHFKLWISDKTFGNDDPLSPQPNCYPLFNAIAL